MNLLSAFCLIFILVGSVFSQTAKISIAILDFEGSKGVEKEQLQAITDRLQSAVIDQGLFSVMDRNQMETVLKEQGFQQATGACTSSDCQIQMGQLLGVDKLVSGKAVKIENIWALSLRYLDVATGRVEKVFSFEVDGDLVDVLRDGSKQGAKLMGDYVKSIQSPEAAVTAESRQVPADAIPKSESRPLSVKRKIAIALWGTSLVSAGAAGYFDFKGSDYKNQWENADEDKDKRALKNAYDDTQAMEKLRNGSIGVSVVSLVAGCVLWFIPEGGK